MDRAWGKNKAWAWRGTARKVGLWLWIALLGLATAGAAGAEGEETGAGSVFVVPVAQTVERGLAAFLDRALTEAEDARAALVVLEIDTPGGRIDSAEEIGLRIRSARVPTLAFVQGKAASAGAYIALNADEIVMSPGSSIGAAMIVDQRGEAVDNPKHVSFWTSEMVAAAQLNGRNPDIAAGMVDPNRVVEMREIGRTKERGQIITLTAQEALQVGYAEQMADDVAAALQWKGLADRSVERIESTLAERVSSFVTTPGIATLLLIVGIAGIAIEMLVPGFGAPGIIGLAAFGLYFFGHSIAGFAGMESLVLFLLGVALLVLEMFVPSFGILGLLGTAGVISGILMSAYDQGDALTSLGVAVAVGAAITVVVAYIFRKRGIWNRFILREQLTAEQGFVPHAPREGWIGKTGVAVSPLRPAGVAEIEGERVDVVTTGSYVEAGKPVRVLSADGTRIVVKEMQIDETKERGFGQHEH